MVAEVEKDVPSNLAHSLQISKGNLPNTSGPRSVNLTFTLLQKVRRLANHPY